MAADPVPQRTAILVGALLALSLASAPMPALAAGVLTDGTVSPTSGTTADVFTLSVHYTSTDSPSRPAQSVYAEVAGAPIAFIRISGSANDGTWQGTAQLPAGTWQVTFVATTSADPQPDPLAGPIVTVTQPPPTPAPTVPPPPPPRTAAPPTPQPVPQPTDSPLTPSSTPGGSATPSASESAVPTPTRTARSDDEASPTPAPSDPATDEAEPGSMLASFLIVGGTMSLVGAAVLTRQWLLTRRGGRRP